MEDAAAISSSAASRSCSGPRSRPNTTISTRSTFRRTTRRAKGLDSFYVRPGLLLRTHTSPMQIRAMQSHPPPIAIVVPGKAYRRDAVDARHSYMFHQIEGLMVARASIFGHLKGMLTGMCRELFGPDQKVRFRPSFFPFTEPSAEVDTTCPRLQRRRLQAHVRRLGLDRDRRMRHGSSPRAARSRLRSR